MTFLLCLSFSLTMYCLLVLYSISYLNSLYLIRITRSYFIVLIFVFGLTRFVFVIILTNSTNLFYHLIVLIIFILHTLFILLYCPSCCSKIIVDRLILLHYHFIIGYLLMLYSNPIKME